MEKSIYELKLHEKVSILDGMFEVVRVPGGWIYESQETQLNIVNPVFVPYNTEFKERTIKPKIELQTD